MRNILFFLLICVQVHAQHVPNLKGIERWSVQITPIRFSLTNYDANGDRLPGSTGLLGAGVGLNYRFKSHSEFNIGTSWTAPYGKLKEEWGLDLYKPLINTSISYIRYSKKIDSYVHRRLSKLSFVHFAYNLNASTRNMYFNNETPIYVNYGKVFAFGAGFRILLQLTPHIQLYSTRGFYIVNLPTTELGFGSSGALRYNFGDYGGRTLFFNKRQGIKGLSLARMLEKIL